MYAVAANAILFLHVCYVSFVVFGLLLTWVGVLLRWDWIRNRWYRGIHLTMIGIVVLEAWIGITCPLTTWENWFRERAGQQQIEGDIIATWLQGLIFFEAPPWVFTCGYTAFGLAVLGTLWFAPPRWRTGNRAPSAIT